MSQFLGLMGVAMMLVVGTVCPAETGAPIACELSPVAYSDRLGEVGDLFKANEETRELDDGYEFRFPGDAESAARLMDLITAERQCCRFFKFELSFEPQEGPIWFRVRGSKEVKAFLKTLMQAD